MQISVHAFPLSERTIENGAPAPVTQSHEAVKDGAKTEQQALGLSGDQVSLSDQAKTSRETGGGASKESKANLNAEQEGREASAVQPEEKANKKAEEKVVKQQVDQLKQRDREVRAHELAHAVTGGAFAGSPKLEFTQGPDGVQYATSGEVSVNTS
ncbi:MAG: hypothetical protein JKY01_06675, partial [Pseudomonadales bacterium]|nr:hypothetical protein [Pseudomonadales bacterium]